MKVVVNACARLHLGLFGLSHEYGRGFGGLGVYINRPRLKVLLNTSSENSVKGDFKPETTKTLHDLETHYGRKFMGTIEVYSEMPVHRGFGSITQLTLAVATAVTKTWGIDTGPTYLARVLGRGKVSNIGTILFQHGGFVVELPKKTNTDKEPSYIRLEFPEEWAFAVAYPKEEIGPDDETEKKLFERIKPMEQARCREMSHVLVNRLLPALVEREVTDFGEALTIFQRLVGEYFSGLQGGVFRSSKAVDVLKGLGALGVGQSSWGPAVYGLFSDWSEAESAATRASKQLGKEWVVFAAKAVNRGAQVSVLP